MTLTFLLVGICYIATAFALRPARTKGRLILAGGAIAGMLVAAFPEYPGGFGSVPHFVFATLGFAGLTFWPAGAVQRGRTVPWGLRAAPGAAGHRGAVRPARLVRRRTGPSPAARQLTAPARRRPAPPRKRRAPNPPPPAPRSGPAPSPGPSRAGPRARTPKARTARR